MVKIKAIKINVNLSILTTLYFRAWDLTNELLSIVLIIKTTGAARGVLLQFEPQNVEPADGKRRG